MQESMQHLGTLHKTASAVCSLSRAGEAGRWWQALWNALDAPASCAYMMRGLLPLPCVRARTPTPAGAASPRKIDCQTITGSLLHLVSRVVRSENIDSSSKTICMSEASRGMVPASDHRLSCRRVSSTRGQNGEFTDTRENSPSLRQMSQCQHVDRTAG